MDNNRMAVDVFNRCAGEYEQKFMDVGLYHEVLDLFCAQLETRRATVLELACGPGNVTRYLLTQRPDLHILATDLSPNMLALAGAQNPEATFSVLDARQLRSTGRRFNAVVCAFGLPYLTKEEAADLIADAAEVLEPGGILYLSTMEDDYSRSGLVRASTGDELYMYYHGAAHLTGTLAAHGFHIIDLRRIVYPGKDGSMVTDLVIIAGL